MPPPRSDCVKAILSRLTINTPLFSVSPRSHYVLAVGPVPYLYFLHQMRLLDIALMALIAFSLAFPVFIWMRPHWQEMLRLESAAQRFGEGHLTERLHFDNGSSFERLGVAFNQMADNINALIASKNS